MHWHLAKERNRLGLELSQEFSNLVESFLPWITSMDEFLNIPATFMRSWGGQSLGFMRRDGPQKVLNLPVLHSQELVKFVSLPLVRVEACS